MSFPPLTLGSILAVVVLVLAIVLGVIGHLPLIYAGLFVLLALARLS